MTVAESAKASYEYILDSVMGKLADKGGGRGFRKARMKVSGNVLYPLWLRWT